MNGDIDGLRNQPDRFAAIDCDRVRDSASDHAGFE
jgi:hypothetical protein